MLHDSFSGWFQFLLYLSSCTYNNTFHQLKDATNQVTFAAPSPYTLIDLSCGRFILPALRTTDHLLIQHSVPALFRSSAAFLLCHSNHILLRLSISPSSVSRSSLSHPQNIHILLPPSFLSFIPCYVSTIFRFSSHCSSFSLRLGLSLLFVPPSHLPIATLSLFHFVPICDKIIANLTEETLVYCLNKLLYSCIIAKCHYATIMDTYRALCSSRPFLVHQSFALASTLHQGMRTAVVAQLGYRTAHICCK